MAIREYKCNSCGKITEKITGYSPVGVIVCKGCGKPAHLQVSAPAWRPDKTVKP